MAELLRCIECGGMVSSEANQCPHCKTRYFRGVVCSVCNEVLKFSEAHKKSSNIYYHIYFHPSCYQKVSQTVERMQTINCPTCSHLTEISYGHTADDSEFYERVVISRGHKVKKITCTNCGHNYQYEQRPENDPYSICRYCNVILEKSLEKYIEDGREGFYSHKVCYIPARQSEAIRQKKSYEEYLNKVEKERKESEWKKKEEAWSKNLKESIFAWIFLGTLVYLSGNFWAMLLFAILFIICNLVYWF